MANVKTLEIPISGMDCAECTQHVQHAIEKLPGVQSVNVFLGTEKAVVRLDPAQVKIVLVAHGHADHFGGNATIVKRTAAKVYAPTIDEAILRYPLLLPICLYAGADPLGELLQRHGVWSRHAEQRLKRFSHSTVCLM